MFLFGFAVTNQIANDNDDGDDGDDGRRRRQRRRRMIGRSLLRWLAGWATLSGGLSRIVFFLVPCQLLAFCLLVVPGLVWFRKVEGARDADDAALSAVVAFAFDILTAVVAGTAGHVSAATGIHGRRTGGVSMIV